jgi:hypothetical protein
LQLCFTTTATQNAITPIFGKTICGATEKRGIEKAYNFFFHNQILECHKNNHTEKKKAPSSNELLIKTLLVGGRKVVLEN